MSSVYEPPNGPASGIPGGKTSLGLESNVGAMLCYLGNLLCCLGLVISIVFLVTEKENRFVKFHALQSLFLFLAGIAVGIIVAILSVILRIAFGMADLGLIAWFLIVGLRLILILIFAVIWIFAGIKAYGGQWYKLPIVGEFAWNAVNK
jgi:uncharacterized membrane protein